MSANVANAAVDDAANGKAPPSAAPKELKSAWRRVKNAAGALGTKVRGYFTRKANNGAAKPSWLNKIKRGASSLRNKFMNVKNGKSRFGRMSNSITRGLNRFKFLNRFRKGAKDRREEREWEARFANRANRNLRKGSVAARAAALTLREPPRGASRRSTRRSNRR